MFKKSVQENVKACKEIKQNYNCSSYYSAFFKVALIRYLILTCVFLFITVSRFFGITSSGVVSDILDILYFCFVIYIVIRDLFVLKELDKLTLESIKASNRGNRRQRRKNAKH